MTRIPVGTWSARLGSFDLTPANQTGPVLVSVHGLRRGKPVPVMTTIESLIEDGSVERVDRWDNRDIQLLVSFDLTDPAQTDALAAAERSLWLAASSGSTEFVWTPPTGFGVATVFDVLWGDLEFSDADDWDLDELDGRRLWVLTLRVLPFGRSVAEVVDNGLAAGTATPITIADGVNLTGWSASVGSLTSSGGAMTQTQTVPPDYSGTGYRHVGAGFNLSPPSLIDLSATPYVYVDYRVTPGGYSYTQVCRLYVDGVGYLSIGRLALTSNYVREFFKVTDPSVTTIFQAGVDVDYREYGGKVAPSSCVFDIDQIGASSTPPGASTTGKESLRTIAVGGSSRTPGSLAIEHATKALGDVLVYTCPDLSGDDNGYQPALRPYLYSGAPGTPGASGNAVSGAEQQIGSVAFRAPAANWPAGTYVIMARVRWIGSGSSFTGAWRTDAGLRVGSGSLLAPQSVTSAAHTIGTSFRIIVLGALTLPPAKVGIGSSASIEIGISAPPGSTDGFMLDEAWAFYMGDDDCSLTQVTAGDGTPSAGQRHNRFWMDAATPDSLVPTIWLGTAANRSDAFHAGQFSLAAGWSAPTFRPPTSKVFVVTTNADNPTVTLRHYPRWHTHAQS